MFEKTEGKKRNVKNSNKTAKEIRVELEKQIALSRYQKKRENKNILEFVI